MDESNYINLSNLDANATETPSRPKQKSNLDSTTEEYLSDMLAKQQNQLDCMVKLINSDVSDMNVIMNDLLEN